MRERITHGARWRRLRAALAGALLLAGLATPAFALNFRAADNQVEDYPTVQALLFMARRIEERTGGRHRVQVFHSAQLGDEKTTIEQTRRGIIDLNRTNISPLTALVPATNALLLPFQFRSTAHMHAVLDGPVGADVLARFGDYGFVGLAFYDSGARSLYNSVRPVRSLADMVGLKIRIQQSALMNDLIRALGAEPVQLSYDIVLPALQNRIIDGAENNWPSYVSTGHYLSARYLTLTEHVAAPEVLFMSRRAWESLSAEDQAVFREAAQASSLFMRERWRRYEEESRQRAGPSIIVQEDFDRAAFTAVTRAVREKYLTDPDVRALSDRIAAVP